MEAHKVKACTMTRQGPMHRWRSKAPWGMQRRRRSRARGPSKRREAPVGDGGAKAEVADVAAAVAAAVAVAAAAAFCFCSFFVAKDSKSMHRVILGSRL